MEFSQHGKLVDNQVRKHMEIISSEISKNIHDVISIMIIGGLARGEGSFLLKNGKIHPLNDYDLYIITKKKISFDKLKKLSEKISVKINDTRFSFSEGSSLMEFYLDIRNMTINEIRKVEPMLKYYEIRESAKVIYGEDVRKQMPGFSIADIPLEDGFRFLMNRMSLIIESFDINNLNNFETKKTVLYYIGKAYLSCAEALLLLNKKFVPSYIGRCKIIKQIYENDFPELSGILPDLPEKIELFTKNKIKPDENFFRQDIADFWFSAREDLSKVISYYAKRAFNLKINPLNSLDIMKLNTSFMKSYMKIAIKSKFGMNIKEPLLSLSSFLGRIYFNYLYFKRDFFLNKRKKFRILLSSADINLRIYSLCYSVIFSLNPDFTINHLFLKKSMEMLKYFGSEEIKEWNRLRKTYSDIFRIYQFLKS